MLFAANCSDATPHASPTKLSLPCPALQAALMPAHMAAIGASGASPMMAVLGYPGMIGLPPGTGGECVGHSCDVCIAEALWYCMRQSKQQWLLREKAQPLSFLARHWRCGCRLTAVLPAIWPCWMGAEEGHADKQAANELRGVRPGLALRACKATEPPVEEGSKSLCSVP